MRHAACRKQTAPLEFCAPTVSTGVAAAALAFAVRRSPLARGGILRPLNVCVCVCVCVCACASNTYRRRPSTRRRTVPAERHALGRMACAAASGAASPSGTATTGASRRTVDARTPTSQSCLYAAMLALDGVEHSASSLRTRSLPRHIHTHALCTPAHPNTHPHYLAHAHATPQPHAWFQAFGPRWQNGRGRAHPGVGGNVRRVLHGHELCHIQGTPQRAADGTRHLDGQYLPLPPPSLPPVPSADVPARRVAPCAAPAQSWRCLLVYLVPRFIWETNRQQTRVFLCDSARQAHLSFSTSQTRQLREVFQERLGELKAAEAPLRAPGARDGEGPVEPEPAYAYVAG